MQQLPSPSDFTCCLLEERKRRDVAGTMPTVVEDYMDKRCIQLAKQKQPYNMQHGPSCWLACFVCCTCLLVRLLAQLLVLYVLTYPRMYVSKQYASMQVHMDAFLILCAYMMIYVYTPEHIL